MINFGQPLSSVAPLPKFAITVNGEVQTFTAQWSNTLENVELVFSENVTYDQNSSVVSASSAIFLPNQLQQYMLNETDFPSGYAPLSDAKATGVLYVHGESDVAGGAIYDISQVEGLSQPEDNNGNQNDDGQSDDIRLTPETVNLVFVCEQDNTIWSFDDSAIVQYKLLDSQDELLTATYEGDGNYRLPEVVEDGMYELNVNPSISGINSFLKTIMTSGGGVFVEKEYVCSN